jgi:hypothetical protein
MLSVNQTKKCEKEPLINKHTKQSKSRSNVSRTARNVVRKGASGLKFIRKSLVKSGDVIAEVGPADGLKWDKGGDYVQLTEMCDTAVSNGVRHHDAVPSAPPQDGVMQVEHSAPETGLTVVPNCGQKLLGDSGGDAPPPDGLGMEAAYAHNGIMAHYAHAELQDDYQNAGALVSDNSDAGHSVGKDKKSRRGGFRHWRVPNFDQVYVDDVEDDVPPEQLKILKKDFEAWQAECEEIGVSHIHSQGFTSRSVANALVADYKRRGMNAVLHFDYAREEDDVVIFPCVHIPSYLYAHGVFDKKARIVYLDNDWQYFKIGDVFGPAGNWVRDRSFVSSGLSVWRKRQPRDPTYYDMNGVAKVIELEIAGELPQIRLESAEKVRQTMFRTMLRIAKRHGMTGWWATYLWASTETCMRIAARDTKKVPNAQSMHAFFTQMQNGRNPLPRWPFVLLVLAIVLFYHWLCEQWIGNDQMPYTKDMKSTTGQIIIFVIGAIFSLFCTLKYNSYYWSIRGFYPGFGAWTIVESMVTVADWAKKLRHDCWIAKYEAAGVKIAKPRKLMYTTNWYKYPITFFENTTANALVSVIERQAKPLAYEPIQSSIDSFREWVVSRTEWQRVFHGTVPKDPVAYCKATGWDAKKKADFMKEHDDLPGATVKDTNFMHSCIVKGEVGQSPLKAGRTVSYQRAGPKVTVGPAISALYDAVKKRTVRDSRILWSCGLNDIEKGRRLEELAETYIIGKGKRAFAFGIDYSKFDSSVQGWMFSLLRDWLPHMIQKRNGNRHNLWLELLQVHYDSKIRKWKLNHRNFKDDGSFTAVINASMPSGDVDTTFSNTLLNELIIKWACDVAGVELYAGMVSGDDVIMMCFEEDYDNVKLLPEIIAGLGMKVEMEFPVGRDEVRQSRFCISVDTIVGLERCEYNSKFFAYVQRINATDEKKGATGKSLKKVKEKVLLPCQKLGNSFVKSPIEYRSLEGSNKRATRILELSSMVNKARSIGNDLSVWPGISSFYTRFKSAAMNELRALGVNDPSIVEKPRYVEYGYSTGSLTVCEETLEAASLRYGVSTSQLLEFDRRMGTLNPKKVQRLDKNNRIKDVLKKIVEKDVGIPTEKEWACFRTYSNEAAPPSGPVGDPDSMVPIDTALFQGGLLRN